MDDQAVAHTAAHYTEFISCVLKLSTNLYEPIKPSCVRLEDRLCSGTTDLFAATSGANMEIHRVKIMC